jgi:ketosteroid isomerase-like protein
MEFTVAAQALQDTASLALMLGDAKLLMQCYSPDAVLIPTDGIPRVGIPTIEAFWAEVMLAGGRGNAAVTEDLDFSGDWMLETGVYARFGDPVALGVPLERGRFTLLHERQPDGRWLWARDVLVETLPFP